MKHLDLLIERYPQLKGLKDDTEKVINALVKTYYDGGKILLCGNGGSASDCEHISGEMLKGFLSKRKIKENEYPKFSADAKAKLQKGIPAVPLTSLSSLISAFSNDVDAEWTYAQLVFALGKKNDMFIGLSTSGNAKNVLHGAETAKAIGLTTVALTGKNDSALSSVCDFTLRVPETETFKVQELHLPLYHAICAQIEEIIFKD